jgi:glycosyltransferase involved in cell wall biosynthesis
LNILFIPHVPNKNVVNRVYEFAKALDSYVLSWEIDNSSFSKKVISQLKSLQFRVNKNEIFIPLLFKPEAFGVKFNTFVLNYLIKKLKIDLVINANALLFDIKKISALVVYDLVDDHLEENLSIGLNLARVKKIKEDIKSSKALICVTQNLAQKAKGLNPRIKVIENGVSLEKFKRARSIKSELGLENRFLFGYIGGVAKWTGIEKACKEFVKIQNSSNAMIIVGESKERYFQNLKREYQDKIHFIGQVPPEDVAKYFKSLDVGLIPFEINDFTNNALPIKALEYGLGGARVLSTPLEALKNKNFPFIKFAKIEEFSKQMQKMQTLNQKVEFDFREFSWEKKAKELEEFLKELV